jgi:hypothetical protein
MPFLDAIGIANSVSEGPLPFKGRDRVGMGVQDPMPFSCPGIIDRNRPAERRSSASNCINGYGQVNCPAACPDPIPTLSLPLKGREPSRQESGEIMLQG